MIQSAKYFKAIKVFAITTKHLKCHSSTSIVTFIVQEKVTSNKSILNNMPPK